MSNRNKPIIAKTEIHLRSPIDKVWQVLAIDFDQIDQWSSGVKHSVARGEPVKRFQSWRQTLRSGSNGVYGDG